MPRSILPWPVSIALVLLAASSAAAAEQSVTLTSVLALEPADSPFGAYRIVFCTAAPLPPPTALLSGPSFLLDDQPVRFPPDAPAGTTHVGYVERAPRGTSRLSAVETVGTPASPPGERSRIEFDAAALLTRARPAEGEYEAAHIRRSAELVDVAAALRTARTTCVGRLLRRDTLPDDKNVWQLHFAVEEPLRGRSLRMEDGLLVLRTAVVGPEIEIGARYVLFVRTQGQPPKPDDFTTLRVWWKADDDVERIVATLGREPAAGTDDFWRAALRSPAADVRFTAAGELLRKGAPDDRSRALAAQRLKTEPDERIRVKLKALSG